MSAYIRPKLHESVFVKDYYSSVTSIMLINMYNKYYQNIMSITRNITSFTRNITSINRNITVNKVAVSQVATI